MLYAIIVTFVIVGIAAHGEGAGEERFATKSACESARPAMIEGFKMTIEAKHAGLHVTILTSRCGLAADVGAIPI